jgi:AcrR family transcriptional regulator
MSTPRPSANPARRTTAPARAAEEAARGDRGTAARDQLLLHATRIFSVKGYAGASTREICEAAGVNVASIHYYFGDKEGLYRAVLLRPITRITQRLQGFDDPALPLEASMRMLLAPFIATSADAEHDRAVMRLHLREMLEPSPVFREVVERSIVPHHNALAQLLARHVGIARPDEGIHQLAFALVAMANDYCMSREFMNLLAPTVLNRADADRHILDRLVGYCIALVQHEIERRTVARAAGRRNGAARCR